MEHGPVKLMLFLPNDEEASWSLLLSLVFVLSGSANQPGNTYSCIRSEKAKSH